MITSDQFLFPFPPRWMGDSDWWHLLLLSSRHPPAGCPPCPPCQPSNHIMFYHHKYSPRPPATHPSTIMMHLKYVSADTTMACRYYTLTSDTANFKHFLWFSRLCRGKKLLPPFRNINWMLSDWTGVKWLSNHFSKHELSRGHLADEAEIALMWGLISPPDTWDWQAVYFNLAILSLGPGTCSPLTAMRSLPMVSWAIEPISARVMLNIDRNEQGESQKYFLRYHDQFKLNVVRVVLWETNISIRHRTCSAITQLLKRSPRSQAKF